MLSITTIGGYSEIGKNCTLISYMDESVILDLGLNMENYVELTEDEEKPEFLGVETLIKHEAIPDLDLIQDKLKTVKAVCISHGHLDHVGAVPFLAEKIKNIPIHGTTFTLEILREMLVDKRVKAKLTLVKHKENERFRVSKNLEVEFVRVTHSIPQTVIIIVHTPLGSVVYANDFKLEENPLFGKKTNVKLLKKTKNVRALIMDSLYAEKPGKTGSESMVKEQLIQILNEKYENIILTTFSSHITRLKTIKDIAKQINRKPVFIGRSMAKYIVAAKTSKLIDIEKGSEIIPFGSHLEKYFLKNPPNPKNLYVVTGNQGEPKAILSRIVSGKFFELGKKDLVVFSCKTIPNPSNIDNREKIEISLRKKGINYFTDVHVSGHASQKDHEELIKMLKPRIIIPTHGNPDMLEAQRQNCKKLGYKDEQILILENGQTIKLK